MHFAFPLTGQGLGKTDVRAVGPGGDRAHGLTTERAPPARPDRSDRSDKAGGPPALPAWFDTSAHPFPFRLLAARSPCEVGTLSIISSGRRLAWRHGA